MRSDRGTLFLIISTVCFIGSFFCFIFLLPRYGTIWIPIYVGLMLTGMYLRQRGKRYKLKPANFLDTISSQKKIVLYLRAFSDDSTFNAFNDAESNIVLNFDKDVKVVGIGLPEEQLQKLGIERLQFPRDTDEWKVAIDQLAEKASLIIICFNSAIGLLFEINLVISKNFLNKTIFYFPVIYKRDNAGLYAALIHLLDTKASTKLPAMRNVLSRFHN